MKTDEPLLKNLYDSKKYCVLGDWLGNIFPYKYDEKAEYAMKDIKFDELPEGVQEEVIKKLI